MDVFVFVRHFSRRPLLFKEEGKNSENAKTPIKKALKRVSQGLKLVAGVGFEPTTFRL